MTATLPAQAPPPAALAAPKPTTGAVTTGEDLGSFQGPTTFAEKLEANLSILLGADRRLTPKRIEAMRTDYQVSACLQVLAGPQERADWSIACEDDDVAAYVTAAFDLVHHDLMRSANRSLWAGFSPNVLVWEYVASLGGLAVTKLRDLPPFTCDPITDERGSYAGFVQHKGQDNEERITGEKVLQTLWLVEDMESGNLRGRSLLAAALDPFLDKATTRLFHTRYLERFGEPQVIVRHPLGVTPINEAEVAAAEAKREGGDASVIVPEVEYVTHQHIARELGMGMRHHSVNTLASSRTVSADGKDIGYDWDVSFLESKRSGGADFLDAIAAQDRAIARGMFIPDLLFSNSDGGAYALGREHRSVFDGKAEARLDDRGRQISRHYLQRLAVLNFGPNAPQVRLEFGGVTDTDRDNRWELVKLMIDKGALHPDVQQLAADLGIALVEEDQEPQADALAASPFATVGLPALIAAGIITEQEGRDLIGIPGTAPGKPAAGALAAVRGVVAALAAGQTIGERGTVLARVALGLPVERPTVALAAGPADVSGLPAYQVPQSYDPPAAYVRELTAREARVPFAKVERELNAAEAATIDLLVQLTEASRERVMAQVKGIMGKGTLAEVIAAISTLDVGAPGRQAKAWETLLRTVWALGLDSVRTELEDFAELVPNGLGAEARAQAATYATASAERHLAALSTELRLSMLNAVTSGTSLAGVQAILGDLYDRELRSEGRPIRLTTRMLAAKGLNEGRRDAIERGGIPLRGAQYSAILDRRTCELCQRQDELVIGVESPDLRRFTPPVHHNCRCLWVWITREELDFTPTWTTPPPSLVDSRGGLVVG